LDTDLVNPADDVLLVEIVDGVATLRIRRPERRNAMDRELVRQLRAAFLRLDRDPAVGAMVLAGGAPGFCAGSDLKFIGNLDLDAMCRFEQECGDLGRLIGFLDTPVVAAVEGFAIGGGFTLATSCDVVVAGRTSRWSLPEVPIGWLTPWGLGSLVARVGPVRARTLCFCLHEMTGSEAREIGVVDVLADDGAAVATAVATAQALARLPRPAVAATKRFFAGHLMRDAEAMDFEANRLFAENCSHPVAKSTLGRFRGPGAAAVPAE